VSRNRCVLVAYGAHSNNVFDADNPFNRDDCLRFFRLWRNEFRKVGLGFDTADIEGEQEPLAAIHIDAGQQPQHSNVYLVLFETPVICPPNGDEAALSRFRRVFTWNDDLVYMQPQRFIKIWYPNNIVVPQVDGYKGRPVLSCMIAGNKTVPVPDPRELYSERIKTVRWFENKALSDFELYGIGWNAPPRRRGFIGRVIHKLATAAFPKEIRWFFPSYRGSVANKAEVYQRCRFAICYEKVRDLPGYITEKIFDAMCAGCVPVYWGASNITDHIPSDCFIDRRLFPNHEALYAFLKSMPEHEYLRYQEAIRAFLASPAATPFSAEAFAATVVDTIVRDLREQGIEI
jgi:hypothetical protein